MKLKDDLGLAARILYCLFGVLLAAATIATAYSDWPAVSAGKESPLGFGLLTVVAAPLSLFIIVWACIGRHREWRIGDSDIRISLLSLTSWRKDLRIKPDQIESIGREQYNYDDEGGRVAYAVTVSLKDGKAYRSPKVFDMAQADEACKHIERLCGRSVASSDEVSSA